MPRRRSSGDPFKFADLADGGPRKYLAHVDNRWGGDFRKLLSRANSWYLANRPEMAVSGWEIEPGVAILQAYELRPDAMEKRLDDRNACIAGVMAYRHAAGLLPDMSELLKERYSQKYHQ